MTSHLQGLRRLYDCEPGACSEGQIPQAGQLLLLLLD